MSSFMKLASIGVGFVLGPAIAGIVSKQFGVAAPFWTAAVLAVVNLVSAAVFLPEPARAVRGAGLRRKRLAAPTELVAVSSMFPASGTKFVETGTLSPWSQLQNWDGALNYWVLRADF